MNSELQVYSGQTYTEALPSLIEMLVAGVELKIETPF